LADISGKIVDGLALSLLILIVLLLGIGIGTLLTWKGSIPEGTVIGPIVVIGSLLVMTTIICYCLRAWVKEQ
jgi:hypothetical protein